MTEVVLKYFDYNIHNRLKWRIKKDISQIFYLLPHYTIIVTVLENEFYE